MNEKIFNFAKRFRAFNGTWYSMFIMAFLGAITWWFPKPWIIPYMVIILGIYLPCSYFLIHYYYKHRDKYEKSTL
jgi:hypothetical protein